MKPIDIYGITEFSENEPHFYANTLGRHLVEHLFINTPHKHSTYVTVLFTLGTGVHIIDFERYEVKPGAVFLLNPGQVHCWNLSADADGYVFFHTREFYNRVFVERRIEDYPFFHLGQNYPVLYAKDAELETVLSLFREMVKEQERGERDQAHKTALLTDLIYVELSRLYPESRGGATKGTPAFEKVMHLQRLIDAHFRTLKFPAGYAEKLNITPRHLSRICRETVGKSPQELITDRIFLEAKRLLVHSDITVAAVAEQLGYDDPSYFIRQFKVCTGRTPKAFQQEMAEQATSLSQRKVKVTLC